VLLWNADHGWVSLLFQSGRAVGPLHALGPVSAVAGQALFVLPWVWLPLLVCGAVALWRGPAEPSGWLPVCLAMPVLFVFTAISLWGNVLYHWAAPGYLMLVPLLGEAVARRWEESRGVRLWLAGSAGFVVLGTALAASEAKFNWLPAITGKDPVVDVVDWTSLRDDLAARGLLDRSRIVAAVLRWSDAGKIDYALSGRIPIICLGPDARQYGLIGRRDDYAGADVLIVTRAPPEKIIGQYWFVFDAIEPLAPVSVLHAGRPALRLNLLLGHRLHKAAEECCPS
jgi:hypothetical protein